MLQPAVSAAQRRIYQAALALFAEQGVKQLSIKELAARAGVARGTIYNHVDSVNALFDDVARALSAEMQERLSLNFRDIHDPELRLAIGIRLYIKRAHDEPDWALFVRRFAFEHSALRRLGAQPVQLLLDGIKNKKYQLTADQLGVSVTMLASSVLGAMYLVKEGIRTWRDAGTDCAELSLRALGVNSERARLLATAPLPASSGAQILRD